VSRVWKDSAHSCRCSASGVQFHTLLSVYTRSEAFTTSKTPLGSSDSAICETDSAQLIRSQQQPAQDVYTNTSKEGEAPIPAAGR
jgi:hypothetical protein